VGVVVLNPSRRAEIGFPKHFLHMCCVWDAQGSIRLLGFLGHWLSLGVTQGMSTSSTEWDRKTRSFTVRVMFLGEVL
jgi:hypothetical protein